MAQLFLNNCYATLAQAITATDTQITLSGMNGFPTSLGAGDYFLLTLYADTTRYGENIEVVKVTGLAGSTLTVERGFEGTAVTHGSLERVEARLTAETIRNLTPTWDQVSSKPATATRWPTFTEVTDKPATFAPSAHTHPWSQVTSKPAQATRWPAFSEVTDKPATYPPTYPNLAGNANKKLSVKADESGVEWQDVAGGTSELPVYVNNAATGTVTLDFSQYNVFEITTAGDITLEATGLASGARASGTVFVDNSIGASVTDNAFDYISQGFRGFNYPFNLSAVDFENVYFDVSGRTAANISNISFANQGTLMFVYQVNTDVVLGYSLSEAYNVRSANFLNSYTFSYSQPCDFIFNDNGSSMIMVQTRATNRIVRDYDLPVVYDPSSIGTQKTVLDASGETGRIIQSGISDDGLTLYLVGTEGVVHQYNLVSPFVLHGWSYSGFSLSLGSTAIEGFYIASPSRAYVTYRNSGSDNQTYIREYDTSSGNVSGWQLVSEHELKPRDVRLGGLFIDPTGTKIVTSEASDGAIIELSSGANFTGLDVVQNDNQLTANWSYY